MSQSTDCYPGIVMTTTLVHVVQFLPVKELIKRGKEGQGKYVREGERDKSRKGGEWLNSIIISTSSPSLSV